MFESNNRHPRNHHSHRGQWESPVTREIEKQSVNNAIRALLARDGHGSPFVGAFYAIRETSKWGTFDGLGVDLIADMYPHCAEMIGLRGQLPLQIKSSAERIEDYIAQKEEVDRRFRLMDPYRLRVLCLNGSLPPDELRLQCALGSLTTSGSNMILKTLK